METRIFFISVVDFNFRFFTFQQIIHVHCMPSPSGHNKQLQHDKISIKFAKMKANCYSQQVVTRGITEGIRLIHITCDF